MKGSCHCGAIGFEVTGKPTWLGKCHCRDCQKIGGGAFMAFAEYELDNVTFTKGLPQTYKSSANVTRTFCGVCGSPIEWKLNDVPNRTSFALGLFVENTGFEKLESLYEEKAPDWY